MKNFKQFPSKDLFCPVTAVEAIFAAIAPAEYHERNKGNSQVLNGDLRAKATDRRCSTFNHLYVKVNPQSVT